MSRNVVRTFFHWLFPNIYVGEDETVPASSAMPTPPEMPSLANESAEDHPGYIPLDGDEARVDQDHRAVEIEIPAEAHVRTTGDGVERDHGRDGDGEPVAEEGPAEVAHAAPADLAITDLSLPEAWALLYGPRTESHEIVYLGLVDLVASGVMVLAGTRGQPTLKRVSDLDDLPPPVEAFARVLFGSPAAELCDPDDPSVRDRFTMRWGTSDGYMRSQVWRDLEQQDLVDTTPHDMVDAGFVVFPFRITARGERLRDEIQSALPSSDDADDLARILSALGLHVPSATIRSELLIVEAQVTPPSQPLDAGEAMGNTR